MDNKMREDFEAWVRLCNKANKIDHMFLNMTENKLYYLDNRTELSWNAWKASRESLIVELPPPRLTDFETYYTDDFKESLNAAGVNYK